MRLKWIETYDKKFLFTQPEAKVNYRIAIQNDKYHGMQYIAELWHEKYEDYERLSPWAWMDCNTMDKAKRLVRKHYQENYLNGKSSPSKKRKL